MRPKTSLFTAMRSANDTLLPPGPRNEAAKRICYNPAFMPLRLIPREEKFYSDFQALADELKRGAKLLEEMVAPDRPIWDKADEIKEVEHKCDFLTHEIIQRLN